ncbi:MAG: metal-dependent phosphohydrolase [Alkalispirochaeta sp.]
MAAQKVTSFKKFLHDHPGSLRILLSERENVLCRNRSTGRVKRMQLRALYENNRRFWEHQERWEYYLDQSVAAAVRERLQQMEETAHQRATAVREEATGKHASRTEADRTSPGTPPETHADQPEEITPVAAEENSSKLPNNFGDTYRAYKSLEKEERVGLLQRTTQRLDALAQQETIEREELAEALVDATQNATMANRATLLEAVRLGNDQAKEYTHQMVVETHKMVKSTMRLVDSDVYNDELVRAVVEKSNGTVVQHMTRVFLSGLEFLLFYNRQVITKGIANRIRVQFAKRYKDFYHALLPHLHDDYVTLEHVFLGGMKALSEVEINKFATGFLVHDVGKAEDIEYHEGDAGYDRGTVERHVKIGYRAVMEKTKYPHEAALITGYHHEYYGHPAGYGYFREFLQAYKDANPAATQDYIMSYTMEPLIDYQVLAYFPAKILEIVDVFDSLTDSNRLYRSPLSPEDALALIREQFIEQNRKIDPVLFDLFLEFYETRWKAR